MSLKVVYNHFPQFWTDYTIKKNKIFTLSYVIWIVNMESQNYTPKPRGFNLENVIIHRNPFQNTSNMVTRNTYFKYILQVLMYWKIYNRNSWATLFLFIFLYNLYILIQLLIWTVLQQCVFIIKLIKTSTVRITYKAYVVVIKINEKQIKWKKLPVQISKIEFPRMIFVKPAVSNVRNCNNSNHIIMQNYM